MIQPSRHSNCSHPLPSQRTAPKGVAAPRHDRHSTFWFRHSSFLSAFRSPVPFAWLRALSLPKRSSLRSRRIRFDLVGFSRIQPALLECHLVTHSPCHPLFPSFRPPPIHPDSVGSTRTARCHPHLCAFCAFLRPFRIPFFPVSTSRSP
jgi:hypothetical protein